MGAKCKAAIGDIFGNWTLLKYVENGKWLCRCTCGVEKDVFGYHLYSGASTKCRACYGVDKRTEAHTHESTYNVWSHMRQRCINPNNDRYHQYGGRGILICERWDSFDLFLEDMGERPEGMSLDRIDVDKGYEPSNCRWATPKEQMRNRTLHKLSPCVTELAEKTGIPYGTLQSRLYRGWTIERAVTTPVKKYA